MQYGQSSDTRTQTQNTGEKWKISFDIHSVSSYLFWRNLGLFILIVLFCGFPVALPGLFSPFASASGAGIWLVLGILGVLVVGGIIILVVSSYQAHALRYELDRGVLRVNQGFVFLSRKAIPLDRITDFTFVQGPLMQACGMWAIRIQTAGQGTPMPEATLYGITDPEHIREWLLAQRDAWVRSRNRDGRAFES